MALVMIFLGLAVLFNFILIVAKIEKGRHLDALVDVLLLIAISQIYGTSIVGGGVATVGSMFISVYLYWFPLIPIEHELNGLTYGEFLDKLHEEKKEDK